MPRRFSCVCGYRWCAARDVCSWAWTRVDATEGAYHVKAGTTGTDQHEEYRQFRWAREVRELAVQREVYEDSYGTEGLVREWNLIASRCTVAPDVTTDPF